MTTCRFVRLFCVVSIVVQLPILVPGKESERRPAILLTNDDGIRSPGLLAVLRELEPFADVFVAAPAGNVSGSSQSISIRGKITIEKLARDDLLGEGKKGAARVSTPLWSIDATPASCVHIAVTKLAKERDFDLVVSGINSGQNIGTDIALSGTLGAARMGRHLGVPAIALSLVHGSTEFAGAARRAVALIHEFLRENRDGEPVLLNVNFPAGPVESWKAPLLTTPAPAGAFRITYRRKKTASGEILEPRVRRNLSSFPEGSDAVALGRLSVSVSPLALTVPDAGWAKRMAPWQFFRSQQ